MTPERLYELSNRLDVIEKNIDKASLIISATTDPYRKWYNQARQRYIEAQAEEAARIMNEIQKINEQSRIEICPSL